MVSLISLLFCLLPIGQDLSPDSSTGFKVNTLDGAFGIDFGKGQEEVIQILKEEYQFEPKQAISQDNYTILEFRSPTHRMRLFFHLEQGVFEIEEEIRIRWDHQKSDQDNLEYHQRRLDRVLRQLRSEYGNEVFLEDTDFGGRFGKENFVTATWVFEKNRWIHVIYEPQDWELFPELNKIFVIYRDSNRDPRD